jgi:hypothetical protein
MVVDPQSIEASETQLRPTGIAQPFPPLLHRHLLKCITVQEHLNDDNHIIVRPEDDIIIWGISSLTLVVGLVLGGDSCCSGGSLTTGLWVSAGGVILRPDPASSMSHDNVLHPFSVA